MVDCWKREGKCEGCRDEDEPLRKIKEMWNHGEGLRVSTALIPFDLS